MTAAPLFAPVLPPGTSHARPIQGEGASDLAGLFALLLAGAQPVQADVALPADPTVHQHHAQLPAAVAGTPVGVNWLDASGRNDSSIRWISARPAPPSDYDISHVIQNGAEAGELNGVTIDLEGLVIAPASPVARRRRSPSCRSRPSPTRWRSIRAPATCMARPRRRARSNLRDAGRGGAGTIAPSSLEGANVDLAEEFTKMIVTQRAYSANARVITTTDEMLDELMRISR